MKPLIPIFLTLCSYLEASSSSPTSTKGSWCDIAKFPREADNSIVKKVFIAQPRAEESTPLFHAKIAQKSAVWKAAVNGQLSFFQANPDAINTVTNDTGVTPLHWAARRGHADLVIYLLTHGAHVNALDTKGNSALSMAAFDGQIAVVRVLLEHRANVNQLDKLGRSILSWAIEYPDIVELLIAHGARVDYKDHLKKEAMHWAVGNGVTESVHLLLKHGASVRTVDAKGSTLLHWAAIGNYISLAEELIALGVPVNGLDALGQSALSWAAYHGYDRCVKMLLARGASVQVVDKKGRTPLHWSTKSVTVTRLLLDAGVKVDARDYEMKTPLSWAAYEGSNDVVSLLLERGADAQSTDLQGSTALQFAASEGHVETVVILLRNEANGGDCYPLSWAAGKGYSSIVELFIKHGVALSSTDPKNPSPLFFAADSGHAEIVKILCKHGANPNEKDGKGQTPLLMAVFKGNPKVVAILLEAGGDVGISDAEGKSPLHWARDRVVAEMLIKRGALVNARDIRGKSPIMWAAFEGNHELVKFFVEAGADLTIMDSNQLNVEALAIMSGNCKLLRYLCGLAECTFLQRTGPKKRTAYHWVLRMSKGSLQKGKEQMPLSVAACMIIELAKRGVDCTITDALREMPSDNLKRMNLSNTELTLLNTALKYQSLPEDGKRSFHRMLEQALRSDRMNAMSSKSTHDSALLDLTLGQ